MATGEPRMTDTTIRYCPYCSSNRLTTPNIGSLTNRPTHICNICGKRFRVIYDGVDL